MAASEAQRLIGISLSKIAQSRSFRGGVSLHKNLLVATVLQKARYIFMEEAYNMVHYHHHHQAAPSARPASADELVGLTAEEATLPENSVPEAATTCISCDKENQSPNEPTYIDLDSSKCDKSSNLLKRRRAVAEWETEEAVASILPKRVRPDEDDSVFLDDEEEDAATVLADSVAKEAKEEEKNNNNGPAAMEIDRITSLVSIFSFSVGTAGEKINRSSASSPDLCSTQAKDVGDVLQQRQFLAMTV